MVSVGKSTDSDRHLVLRSALWYICVWRWTHVYCWLIPVCGQRLPNPLCLASRWQRKCTNSTGTITMRASWSVSCGWLVVCVCLCSWVCRGALRGFRCQSGSRSVSALHTRLCFDWNGQQMDWSWTDRCCSCSTTTTVFKGIPYC